MVNLKNTLLPNVWNIETLLLKSGLALPLKSERYSQWYENTLISDWHQRRVKLSVITQLCLYST